MREIPVSLSISTKRLIAALVALLVCPSARAADCTPRTQASPCIDMEPLWVPASPTPFLAVPSARALPAQTFALALHLSSATRPATIIAASPDPAGREVRVVDRLVGGALAAAYGIVLATKPLSSQDWHAVHPGEMIVLEDGLIRFPTHRPSLNGEAVHAKAPRRKEPAHCVMLFAPWRLCVRPLR